jgi:hypothetical protein
VLVGYSLGLLLIELVAIILSFRYFVNNRRVLNSIKACGLISSEYEPTISSSVPEVFLCFRQFFFFFVHHIDFLHVPCYGGVSFFSVGVFSFSIFYIASIFVNWWWLFDMFCLDP